MPEPKKQVKFPTWYLDSARREEAMKAQMIHPRQEQWISSRNFKVPAVVGLAPSKQKSWESICKCRDELYHTSAKLGTLSLQLKIGSPSWSVPGLSRISFIMEPLPSSAFSLNHLKTMAWRIFRKKTHYSGVGCHEVR